MSKRGAHVDELRAMSSDELQEHLRQQRRRLFEVRFQQAAGQVENHRQIRVLRREIARALTVQIELQGLEALAPVAPVAPAPAPPRRRGRAAKPEPEPLPEAAPAEDTENGG